MLKLLCSSKDLQVLLSNEHYKVHNEIQKGGKQRNPTKKFEENHDIVGGIVCRIYVHAEQLT